MHRIALACIAALSMALLSAPSVAAQDWYLYDEAANVVALRDTGIHLDPARLERVRSGLARSRAAFPRLRHIQAEGAGTVLYLAEFLFPADVRHRLSRLSGTQARRRWGVWWVELPSTGFAPLDSLNREFGAARVLLAVDSVTRSASMTIAVEFARPTNIGRLERIYAAAGVPRQMSLRDFTKGFYPGIVWTPGREYDVYEFFLSSECYDPCQRSERYRVRVPLNGGPVQMLEEVVRTDPIGRVQ